MTFQQTIAGSMAGGVIGELAKGNNGYWKARPGIIDSVGTTNLNEVGRVFTQVPANDDHCTVAGVIGEGAPFFGILANPKEYALRGTAAGTLAPTLALPQYSIGDFVYSTDGMYVAFQAAGNIGDFCDYNTTTGLITPRASFGTTGVGTLAITSNVGTIAALPAGSAPIGVGTVFNTLAGPATVISLGTGTGGNGTYNLSVIANQAATANTSYNTIPAAGNAQIPGALVAFKNIPAAGVGIMALGNI